MLNTLHWIRGKLHFQRYILYGMKYWQIIYFDDVRTRELPN